jgi:hypothetical protein
MMHRVPDHLIPIVEHADALRSSSTFERVPPAPLRPEDDDVLREIVQAVGHSNERAEEVLDAAIFRALRRGFSVEAICGIRGVNAHRVRRLASKASKALAEEYFDEYLRQTGHDGWDDPEPDLGSRRDRIGASQGMAIQRS